MNEGSLKVLIADDEPDILAVMAKHIAGEGYRVITVADGKDAWEKIQSENPDIILLDLMMPRLNGYGVLTKLREEPPSDKWQPVIIVSAKGDLEDMQQGFAMEADHYLTKPCKMEDILKAIKLMAGLIPYRKTRKDMEKELEPR